MARKKKADSLFTLELNGHKLRGEKRAGKWEWSCEEWPDLVQKHNGSASVHEMVGDFTVRALEGC